MNLEILPNYVPEALAEQILQNIYSMPYDWWFHSYKYSNNNPENFRYNLAEQEDKIVFDSKIVSSLRGGFFTYKFSRTLSHKATCPCFLCTTIPALLRSPIVRDCISSYYPGLKELEFSEYFISKYSSGDFLSSHHDKERGIAFVWNLTKDWKPEYGGNLSLIDPQTKNIKTIIPTFNTLSIFNLQEEVTHWVSEVSSIAPKERIAITGWFNKSAL